MIPNDSPVNRALIVTPKTIANEQETLRRRIRLLMPRADDVLEMIGDLSVLNPTNAQREHIINHLQAAIQKIEQKFSTVTPRQTQFELPCDPL